MSDKLKGKYHPRQILFSWASFELTCEVLNHFGSDSERPPDKEEVRKLIKYLQEAWHSQDKAKVTEKRLS